MPAFYAHHRFGEKVRQELDRELLAIVDAHRPQFDIGLQGPDLFFFYRPYSRNRVSKYGHHLHQIPAYPFFQHAFRVIEKSGVNSPEYAYLLGFICHYILDSECHGYVDLMIKETGVAHLEIEEEFEKMLLRMDGHDPLAYPLGDLVPQDRKTAEAICPFYDNMTVEVARQSLADLRMVKRLFTAPGRLKHGMINTAMKLTGHYAQVKGLMNHRKDNPACAQTNRGLLERFDAAVPLAASMMKSYDDSLRTGSRLDPRFNRDFK